LNPSEQRLSYIIPVKEPSEALKATVISLTQQTSIDFDIFLVDYASDRQSSKAVHTFALDLCEAVPQLTIRYAKSEAPHELAAFNTGVNKAVAPNVAFLQPGDTVSPQTTHFALQYFARDVTGLVLPKTTGAVGAQQYFGSQGGIQVGEFLTGPFFYPNIFARRLALLELGGFRDFANPALACKELIARLIFKGWSIESSEQLEITPFQRDYSVEIAQLADSQPQTISAVVSALKADFESDPFAKVRAAVRDPRGLFVSVLGR
jgi:hypothetical protein